MKIGQDISIQTCRDEGYGVIEFKVKDLYPSGKGKMKGPINKDHDILFTRSYPDHIRKEIGLKTGQSIIMTRFFINWNDLWEIYQKEKEGIDSMIGGSYTDDNPSAYDILGLASDIDMYSGVLS